MYQNEVRAVHSGITYAWGEQHPNKLETHPHVGLMLGQRRRQWSTIKPILGQCLVFAGMLPARQ